MLGGRQLAAYVAEQTLAVSAVTFACCQSGHLKPCQAFTFWYLSCLAVSSNCFFAVSSMCICLFTMRYM